MSAESSTNYTREDLARDLERLLQLDLSTKDALARWYAEARLVQDRIDRPPFGGTVPESVRHFLIDADIRAKDPRYRELQEAELRRWLNQPPTDEPLPDPYAEFWNRLGFRRAVALTAFLLAPISGLVLAVLGASHAAEFAMWFAFVGVAVLSVMSVVLAKCPRCGRPIFARWWGSNFFGRGCVHCGLRRGES